MERPRGASPSRSGDPGRSGPYDDDVAFGFDDQPLAKDSSDRRPDVRKIEEALSALTRQARAIERCWALGSH